jgi:hypothetical protein
MPKKKSSSTVKPPKVKAKVKLELVKSKTNLTVPQRFAAVMQDRTMTGPEVEAALAAAGETFKSGNLRAYISTMLNSSKRTVTDTQGNRHLVHYFTSEERGCYRVATPSDIQREMLEPRKTAATFTLEQRQQQQPSARPRRDTTASPRRDTTASPKHNATRAASTAGAGAGAGDISLRSLIREVMQEDGMRHELRLMVRQELRSIFKTGLD